MNTPFVFGKIAKSENFTDRGKETIHQAHTTIVEQLSPLFVTITESLSNNQIHFLKTLIAGETALSSAEVILKYRLSSSAEVIRSRKTILPCSLSEKHFV